MRAKHDMAWPKFTKSGNGDGGPVDESDQFKTHSSVYWDFCGGDTSLFYFYAVCMDAQILESAASKMPSSAVNSSDDTGSSTSEKSPRKKIGKKQQQQQQQQQQPAAECRWKRPAKETQQPSPKSAVLLYF